MQHCVKLHKLSCHWQCDVLLAHCCDSNACWQMLVAQNKLRAQHTGAATAFAVLLSCQADMSSILF